MRKLLVLIAAVAFVAAFTAPAFAAEWSFYGSSRITTFWGANSDERAPTGDDDTDLSHTLQGNSRIGANVKAGEIAGQFEVGFGSNITRRIIWGEYDFGGWQLGLGKATAQSISSPATRCLAATTTCSTTAAYTADGIRWFEPSSADFKWPSCNQGRIPEA